MTLDCFGVAEAGVCRGTRVRGEDILEYIRPIHTHTGVSNTGTSQFMRGLGTDDVTSMMNDDEAVAQWCSLGQHGVGHYWR